ncbi:MAG TPA: hypothetical protein VN151_05665 [Terracidiphilus sp.]|nr:hypothetical protein [Terracidiphilus sp.]
MAAEHDRCTETVSSQSRIVVRDRGTNVSAIFLNPDHCPAERIRLDGCLIPRGQMAADFLISFIGVVDVIVELKGTDVRHALDQIEAAFDYLQANRTKKKRPPNSPVVSSLLVCSCYPRNNTHIERRRDRLRRKGVRLITAHSKEEHTFSKFLGNKA